MRESQSFMSSSVVGRVEDLHIFSPANLLKIFHLLTAGIMLLGSFVWYVADHAVRILYYDMNTSHHQYFVLRRSTSLLSRTCNVTYVLKSV